MPLSINWQGSDELYKEKSHDEACKWMELGSQQTIIKRVKLTVFVPGPLILLPAFASPNPRLESLLPGQSSIGSFI